MRSLLTFSGLVAIAGLTGCFCKDVPVEHKLADCAAILIFIVCMGLCPFLTALAVALWRNQSRNPKTDSM